MVSFDDASSNLFSLKKFRADDMSSAQVANKKNLRAQSCESARAGLYVGPEKIG